MNKRKKHVVDTGEIPHLWAHRTQDEARNRQGNLYFTGDTIYSYGSHFPIARHVTNDAGVRSVLFTTATYSVTTSSHCSAVRSAIPSGIRVFHVPNVCHGRYSGSDLTADDHTSNLADYAERIEKHVVTSARARSSYAKAWNNVANRWGRSSDKSRSTIPHLPRQASPNFRTEGPPIRASLRSQRAHHSPRSIRTRPHRAGRNRQGRLSCCLLGRDRAHRTSSRFHSQISQWKWTHLGGAIVRITKRKKELLRRYQRERERGFPAKWALSNARTRLEWNKHEVAEYSSGDAIDPKRGNVRLRVVPDEMCSLEDLEGDRFNSQANPDIPASRLQRDREDFIAKVNRDGVWGIIGEYFDGEAWTHADSCFGFVGDDWNNSGYDTDIMRTTLDEAEGIRVCRCCGRPIVTKTEVR